MGRKGVSKRKAKQIKSKRLTSDNESNSVSSIVNPAKSQPVKTLDTSKALPFPRGSIKTSSDRIKNSRKG